MKRSVLLVACLVLTGMSEASALTLKPEMFDAGIQLSHITYKEPGLMRESGYMYGVNASYARIGKALMWKVDGTLTTGKVDYVGSYQDGTSLTVKGISDTMFETRGVIGPTDFVYLSEYYLPYIGFGYRYLFDGANKGPGGYRRESTYLYIPIGIEGAPKSRDDWSFGYTLEYDLFISGTQKSYLSDADQGFNDVENQQSTGHGYRVSLRFVRSGKQDIIIEPFYKYWKIDRSNMKPLTYYGAPTGWGLVEPDNNSTEIGVKFILKF